MAKTEGQRPRPRAAAPGPATLVFDLAEPDGAFSCSGFSGREPIGRWTDGKRAELTLPVPEEGGPVLFVTLEARGFVADRALPCQRVAVSVEGIPDATWTLHENIMRRRVLAVDRARLGKAGQVVIGFDLLDCAQPAALGLGPDRRYLAMMIRRVTVQAMAERPPPGSLVWQYGRPVGGEAAKSFDRRIDTGFWSRFVTGPNVLDIGFRGYGGTVQPILPGAIGVDLDYPGYDGRRLPFPDGSQDAVFSSHCLEHIPAYVNAIQDWHRVVKLDGHIVTVVPNMAIYERKVRPPSRWNDDHQRFYTPSRLLAEFEQALAPNCYRVRLLEENDESYRYDDGPEVHPFGCYEIVLVIQKIRPPAWRLED